MDDLWNEYLKGWECYERKEYILALQTFQSIQLKMDHLSWLPNGKQKDRDFPSESRQQCDKDMYKLVSSYKE